MNRLNMSFVTTGVLTQMVNGTIVLQFSLTCYLSSHPTLTNIQAFQKNQCETGDSRTSSQSQCRLTVAQCSKLHDVAWLRASFWRVAEIRHEP